MLIKKINAGFKREGYVKFGKKLLCFIISSSVAIPLVLMVTLISPWIRIRLIRLLSFRIGHYAHNTELLLCALETQLFKDQKKTKTLFYVTPGDPICNKQLHKMWKRTIPILPFPLLCNQIDELLKRFFKKYRNDKFKKIFETTAGGHDQWNFFRRITKTHLTFTEEEKKRGQALLNKMGIPSNAKFVCLIMRDAGYLKNQLPHLDWSYHDYRDVNINNYKKAAQFLVNKGLYVVRMGKYVTEKFTVDDAKVIDYANSNFHSDFMDIYLSANCFFMISTSCGLDSVAQVFRKPVLITDFPLTELTTGYYWTNFIPKKMVDSKHKRTLTFSEIYKEKELFSNKKSIIKILKEKQWYFQDNTAEEIIEVLDEMLMRLSKKWKDSEENQLLQEKFWASFPLKLPETISSYKNLKMRIGEVFIKNHQTLLN